MIRGVQLSAHPTLPVFSEFAWILLLSSAVLCTHRYFPFLQLFFFFEGLPIYIDSARFEVGPAFIVFLKLCTWQLSAPSRLLPVDISSCLSSKHSPFPALGFEDPFKPAHTPRPSFAITIPTATICSSNSLSFIISVTCPHFQCLLLSGVHQHKADPCLSLSVISVSIQSACFFVKCFLPRCPNFVGFFFPTVHKISPYL